MPDVDESDRFMFGMTVGWIVAVAVVVVGFATAPDGSGVWYGFGVVIAAIIVAIGLTLLLGYENTDQ